MRIVTLAPALSAIEEDSGGLTLRGFPLTNCFVDSFPTVITIPVVVTVCTLAGSEYRPALYLIADSPTGERVSTMEFRWEWPDSDDLPVKYRAFVQNLPLHLESEGTYLLSLHDTPTGGPTEHTFPLPVFLKPAASRGVEPSRDRPA